MTSVTASHVLNTHVDMIERYRNPPDGLTEANYIFGLPKDLVLRMLGTARTYQVTEPMIVLAEHLSSRQDNPVLGKLDPAEFPYRNGFLWLDKPLTISVTDFKLGAWGPDALVRVDVPESEAPEEVVAISWLKTEAYTNIDGMSVPREAIPKSWDGVPEKVRRPFTPGTADGRREWATAAWVIFWIEPPDEQHRQLFGPLFPCGWVVFPGYRARVHNADNVVVSLLRALWALMDMELASTERHEPNRQLRKRAAKLQIAPDMRVISLRRVHKVSEGPVEHREIDWSCQWLVRPHTRHYSNGKETRVRAYIKGPEDKPLRLNEVADAVLWKLRR